MLTISKLKRWSINYYIDTPRPPRPLHEISPGPAADWGSTTPNAKPLPRCGDA